MQVRDCATIEMEAETIPDQAYAREGGYPGHGSPWT